jgi:ectoine hydroxylase-related dioxygenase (phytanoyl-CoA dioxygenase family)
MRAGDLLIWNRLLAHGNGRNVGARPRLAQYLTMYPAADDEGQRQERIACWREGRAPGGWEREIPERYRGCERHRVPAELTPLGRKLLGLDLW